MNLLKACHGRRPGVSFRDESVLPCLGGVRPQPTVHRLVVKISIDPIPSSNGQVIGSLCLLTWVGTVNFSQNTKLEYLLLFLIYIEVLSNSVESNTILYIWTTLHFLIPAKISRNSSCEHNGGGGGPSPHRTKDAGVHPQKFWKSTPYKTDSYIAVQGWSSKFISWKMFNLQNQI